MASSTSSLLRRTFALTAIIALSICGRSLAATSENVFGSKDLPTLASTDKEAHLYRLTIVQPSKSPILIEVSADRKSPSLTVKEIRSESKGREQSARI